MTPWKFDKKAASFVLWRKQAHDVMQKKKIERRGRRRRK
jgi:hypothetical protein